MFYVMSEVLIERQYYRMSRFLTRRSDVNRHLVSNRCRRLTTETRNVTFLCFLFLLDAQHAVTWRCVEVENVRTWDVTLRREREYLIKCHYDEIRIYRKDANFKT